MKKLFLLLLFVTSVTFGQIKIQPIKVGWPEKTATDLMVRVLPFETDSKTCGLYWELKTDSKETLGNGNIYLTEEEFTAWAADNRYIEDLALCRLILTRKIQ